MTEAQKIIKQMLKETGVKQSHLAEYLDVSPGTVNHWVAGRNDIKDLDRVIAAIEELAYVEPEKKPTKQDLENRIKELEQEIASLKNNRGNE